jgi:hypothetical protein
MPRLLSGIRTVLRFLFQVLVSSFPTIDHNLQAFVRTTFTAKVTDFQKATWLRSQSPLRRSFLQRCEADRVGQIHRGVPRLTATSSTSGLPGF